MTNKTEHICVKSDKITKLELNHTSMAENIKDIKAKISNIDTKIDTIIEFVLTSPQKFADKNEFESFKD